MSKFGNLKPSETLYRRIVETDGFVYTLSILKYPVNADSFYYTMRIFELQKCDQFLDQVVAETVTHEKSVFGRSSKSLPDLVEMVRRLESWFSSDFLQQNLSLDP